MISRQLFIRNLPMDRTELIILEKLTQLRLRKMKLAHRYGDTIKKC